MRRREDIIKELEEMGYIATTKDIYKLTTDKPDEFYAVDFRVGVPIAFKWQDNERITDKDDVRVKDDGKFLAVFYTVNGLEAEASKKVEASENSDVSRFADDDEQNVVDASSYNIGGEVNESCEQCASAIIDLIRKYVGNDVLEVFGDTGTGKSKLCLHVAQEAIKAGMKVYYLDTERNLTEDDLKSIKGATYKYTPDMAEIKDTVLKLPKCDAVIIDSIGFPILTEFAMMSLKERGDALLNMIAIFGSLKKWCYHNNGFALVTNQPESEFNKDKNHILRPFGDKSQFAAKEIWKTEYIRRSQRETRSKIIAFRSRSAGYQTQVAEMTITNDGVLVR